MSPNNQRRMKYKQDFLKKVIVRIDFDSALPIISSGPPENIYTLVKERFPLTEEKKIMGKELLIGKDFTKERSIESKEWHYFGRDREKVLTISPGYMVLTYKKYEYYEVLRDDFLSVTSALFDVYTKIQVKRLGLRYIDNINISEDNPTDWRIYLKPELCTIFNLADRQNTISRAFHVLEFNYGEDFLRFQFGMFNPDHPAPIKKKIYTLDYDMYTARLIDRNDIGETLDRFHEKVNQSFEEVITDELRRIMEPMDE